ncbi:unnamed protein product [Hermetia illucens]|uniref:CHK kinase-like domain-containing protein n=1 Tax=Hermetia illucens TaxID=343691 RepID=A0A7R8YZS6_HERIL|nr:uncharacterized protein LOC119658740 [Hermetia illucens]CAD7091884.1 unnamed protein product [Hermetia illucens]
MVSETENGSNGEITNGNSTVPEWLNEEYFKDILDKEFGKHEITKFSAESATGKGENYASRMTRVLIDLQLEDGTPKSVRYIVKSLIGGELSQSFLGTVFPKEIEMYEKIVPQINNLYKEAGVDFSVGAKCIKTQIDPPAIILEDLVVAGYENISRFEGMDLDHVHVTLEKLARFHAATARIYEINGPYSEHFNKGIFGPEMLAMMEKMVASTWEVIKSCIQKWGDCEVYIEKMEKLFLRFCDLILEAEKMDPNDFNVLNHGDTWCNNIMFKHNKDGTIDDLKFVDLQVSKWGSPVWDLQYFIISSCSYDIRIEKFDYFVKYYHQHLIESLKLLKYAGKLPKLVEIQIQMLKRGYVCLNTMIGTLSAVLLDPNDSADIEMFFKDSDESDKFRKLVYMTPRYVKAAKSILPFLDNRGILDL